MSSCSNRKWARAFRTKIILQKYTSSILGEPTGERASARGAARQEMLARERDGKPGKEGGGGAEGMKQSWSDGRVLIQWVSPSPSICPSRSTSLRLRELVQLPRPSLALRAVSGFSGPRPTPPSRLSTIFAGFILEFRAPTRMLRETFYYCPRIFHPYRFVTCPRAAHKLEKRLIGFINNFCVNYMLQITNLRLN